MRIFQKVGLGTEKADLEIAARADLVIDAKGGLEDAADLALATQELGLLRDTGRFSSKREARSDSRFFPQLCL